MGIEDMVQIETQAEEFMQKAPEQREKLLYIAILRTDRRISKIEKEGCSKADIRHGNSAWARWTPATIGTTLSVILIAVLEWLRKQGVNS